MSGQLLQGRAALLLLELLGLHLKEAIQSHARREMAESQRTRSMNSSCDGFAAAQSAQAFVEPGASLFLKLAAGSGDVSERSFAVVAAAEI